MYAIRSYYDFKKAGKGAFNSLREFRVDNVDEYNLGDEIRCEVFSAGDIVDITGTSKGKGFQGVIKRWNFAGGRSSHGSKFHRAPGSIGCSAWPSRVFKGKRMAGQMGNVRVTTQNLVIVDVITSYSIHYTKLYEEDVEIVGIHPTSKSVVTGVEMFRKLLDQGQAGDNVGRNNFV